MPTGFGNPLKSAFNVVKQAHVVGTKALVTAAKDPRVQQAAAQSASQYAQQNPNSAFAQKYGQAQQAYAKYNELFRMPQQPGAPLPMPMPMMQPEPPPTSKSGLITFAAIGGGLLLVFLLTRN